MTVVYVYEPQATYQRIAAELVPNLLEEEALSDFFPLENIQRTRLIWTQDDNQTGIMSLRGEGGSPTNTSRIGQKSYEATPGFFGNFLTLGETELMERTGTGNFDGLNVDINVHDLVAADQGRLAVQYRWRWKQMMGTLLNTGTLTINLPDGSPGYSTSYTQQTFSPGTAWTTHASATPLLDLMNLQINYGRGTSNDFGSRATAYMSSKTFQDLRFNSNSADLYGRFPTTTPLAMRSLKDVNEILLASGAPQVKIVETGYLNASGTWVLDFPDGVVQVLAARPTGEKPGAAIMTKNALNPGMAPGVYSFVNDFQNAVGGVRIAIPPRIDVHMGFNGGAVMKRTLQVVTITSA